MAEQTKSSVEEQAMDALVKRFEVALGNFSYATAPKEGSPPFRTERHGDTLTVQCHEFFARNKQLLNTYGICSDRLQPLGKPSDGVFMLNISLRPPNITAIGDAIESFEKASQEARQNRIDSDVRQALEVIARHAANNPTQVDAILETLDTVGKEISLENETDPHRKLLRMQATPAISDATSQHAITDLAKHRAVLHNNVKHSQKPVTAIAVGEASRPVQEPMISPEVTDSMDRGRQGG